ncbi:BRCA2 and CDKN1A-interacting protein isoform X2 [Ornithorhynchus anatinus]|uniref:BRCA2 and CDKN1A interacting protein n=1 Tax=Ornithorhynchus anatinus TaxID=9258 RepID=F6SUU8_ORNAN|nr:BRCA2 and CDKN1A-interacting protein isoform X2 [Ornithorhynchus anatinus]
MASSAKRRAVGSGAPRPVGARRGPAPKPHGDQPDQEDEQQQDEQQQDEQQQDEQEARQGHDGLGRDDGDTDDDDEDDDEDDEEEEGIDEEVNVEFEAHSISDQDYNGIKKLLQQLFLKAAVNVAELTGLLIQQSHIGSVIKQTDVPEESEDERDSDDEEEIFGFISLLNLTERKGTPCAEQIEALLLDLCRKSGERQAAARLQDFLADASRPVGLILSERFLNMPPQVALPLHLQLRKELAETQKTNKPCGRCAYFLLLSKTFVAPAPGRAGGDGKRGGPRRTPDLMFANAEEEFFYEKALLKFSYSVQEESDSCLGGRWSFADTPMKPMRTVMLVAAAEMDAIMDKLKEHLAV